MAIQDTNVYGSGVKIDTAIEFMLLSIESHRGLLLLGLRNGYSPVYSQKYSEGEASMSITVFATPVPLRSLRIGGIFGPEATSQTFVMLCVTA